MKKTIIIYGNCQAQIMADCLMNIPEITSQLEVIWERNFEHSSLPLKKGLSREQLMHCAYLMEQLGNKELAFPHKEFLPANCIHLRFPYLRFDSLWPLMEICDPRNKPEPPNYPFGRFPVGDKIVLDMINRNIPRETIYEEYKNINILDHIDLDEVHKSNVNRMRRIDEKCDIKIGDYIDSHFRTERLFHIFSHPVHELLKIILIEILEFAGLIHKRSTAKNMALTFEPAPLMDSLERYFCRPTNYNNMQIPIHPQVCEYFNLSWAHATSTYPYYNFGDLTFWEYMKLYIDFDFINDSNAMKHISNKNLPLNKNILDQIQSSDPSSPEMLILEGEMNFRMGNIKEAEKVFLEILRTHPNHLDALNNLACIRITEAKWDEAVDLLGKVLALDSSCEDALENLKFIKEKANEVALNDMPAIFHITHWKAGSQWIKQILNDCLPGRVVDTNIGIVDFTDFARIPKEEGWVYPALYITKDEFHSMNLPENWKGFVVIRDLRDTLISAYFSFKISHPLATQYNVDLRNKLKALDMEQGLIYLIETWLPVCARIQESWIKSDFEIIHYEDLLSDILQILKRTLIEKFQMPISPEALKKVILANRFEVATGGRKRGREDIESHWRKGIKGDWKNFLNDNLKKVFKIHYGELLIKTGYENSLDW